MGDVSMAVCEASGVRFLYPDDWELTTDDQGPDVSFHLQTSGTGFWTMTLLASRPTAREAVDAVVAGFREAYRELDLYDSPDTGIDGPAAGCELDFVCVDLVSTAVVRAEATSAFTAVVLYQAEDREFETLRARFEQIAASLKYNGEDLPDDVELRLPSPRPHDHDCGHDHDHGN
jgi:hypothetical protein